MKPYIPRALTPAVILKRQLGMSAISERICAAMLETEPPPPTLPVYPWYKWYVSDGLL
jgi:hypothetical protein